MRKEFPSIIVFCREFAVTQRVMGIPGMSFQFRLLYVVEIRELSFVWPLRRICLLLVLSFVVTFIVL